MYGNTREHSPASAGAFIEAGAMGSHGEPWGAHSPASAGAFIEAMDYDLGIEITKAGIHRLRPVPSLKRVRVKVMHPYTEGHSPASAGAFIEARRAHRDEETSAIAFTGFGRCLH